MKNWPNAHHNDLDPIGVVVDKTGIIYRMSEFPTEDLSSVNTQAQSLDYYLSTDNWQITWSGWRQSGMQANNQIRKMTVDDSPGVNISVDYRVAPDLDPGPGTMVPPRDNGNFVIHISPDGDIQRVRTSHSGDLNEEIRMDKDGNTFSCRWSRPGGLCLTDPMAGKYLNLMASDLGFSPSSNTPSISVAGINADLSKEWILVWDISRKDSMGNFDIDGEGNSYIAATFQSPTDFDPGEGTDTRTPAGESDAFLIKVDSAGKVVWVLTVGGASDEPDGGMHELSSQ